MEMDGRDVRGESLGCACSLLVLVSCQVPTSHEMPRHLKLCNPDAIERHRSYVLSSPSINCCLSGMYHKHIPTDLDHG